MNVSAEDAATRNTLAQSIFDCVRAHRADFLPGYTVEVQRTTLLTVMLTIRAEGHPERCFVLRMSELM